MSNFDISSLTKTPIFAPNPSVSNQPPPSPKYPPSGSQNQSATGVQQSSSPSLLRCNSWPIAVISANIFLPRSVNANAGSISMREDKSSCSSFNRALSSSVVPSGTGHSLCLSITSSANASRSSANHTALTPVGSGTVPSAIPARVSSNDSIRSISSSVLRVGINISLVFRRASNRSRFKRSNFSRRSAALCAAAASFSCRSSCSCISLSISLAAASCRAFSEALAASSCSANCDARAAASSAAILAWSASY